MSEEVSKRIIEQLDIMAFDREVEELRQKLQSNYQFEEYPFSCSPLSTTGGWRFKNPDGTWNYQPMNGPETAAELATDYWMPKRTQYGYMGDSVHCYYPRKLTIWQRVKRKLSAIFATLRRFCT